jgi:hypothetical protein
MLKIPRRFVAVGLAICSMAVFAQQESGQAATFGQPATASGGAAAELVSPQAIMAPSRKQPRAGTKLMAHGYHLHRIS